MSNVWSLRCPNIEKFANFVWRMALIFFGLKFVLSVVASILFIYALAEPGMQTHKFTGFSASVGELTTSITWLLQLVAVRFVLEVSLRLVGERTSTLLPSLTDVPAA
ncbi:hypothetical protein EN873_23870 [bacterium M00.F.Ca.ET.230.01.1.1]|nr:hypothetical protein EN873_23870 [bacterium M00.F.Ca.ET.230.01.1.1]